MKNAKDNYQRFQEQKTKLESMLARTENIFSSLNMTADEAKVKDLKEKVKSETFRVMVLGRFNVGKSTFINALLGEEILPAYAIPCTAVINEIKYSEKRSARLFFKNPLPLKIHNEISERAKNYIKEYNGKTPPPLDINVNELMEYVVIPKSDREQAESIAETPYEKVELYWDLEICKDGVEIIDSPGLDESTTRTLITFNYLNKADAILFIMSCESLCSAREMEYIDNNIRGMGHEYIFFINNRINQIREKEKKELIDYGKARLQAKTSFGEKGIFFLNALGAIDGRLENNSEKLQQSGILPLEELLSDFLANKKGKIKILQPATNFTSSLRRGLFDEIPWQRSLLSNSFEEIKKKYEEQQPKLVMLDTQKKHILENISLRLEAAMYDIRQVISENMTTVRENIPLWINEITLTTEFKPMHPKESSAAIIKELLEKLTARMEHEQIKWQEDRLTPLIDEKMKYVFDEHRENLEQFFKGLEDLKIGLSGIDPQKEALKETSQAERIAALIVGLFLPGAAPVAGYQFGFSKEFLKQIGIQVAAAFVLVLAGITNPIILIPVLIAVFFAGGMGIGIDDIKTRLKERISVKITGEFSKNSKNATDQMLKEISSGMESIKLKIGDSLEKELDSVKSQVEKIIKEMEADDQNSSKRKKLLNICEADLKNIDIELNDLIISLAEQY